MRKRICVLEDDEGIRDVIGIILSDDYDVEAHASVKSFNDRNRNDKADLFLLDVMLPDGSGVDVCNEIRTIQANTRVPIIIMSAAAKPNEVTGKCSANDFLAKPFDINHLVNSIKNALN